MAANIGTPLAQHGNALGPLADDDTPELSKQGVQDLTEHLAVSVGDFSVETPESEIRGLLLPFNGRARVVIARMLQGYSQRMAATAAGIDIDTVTRWGKRYPDFALAIAKARDWGFSRTFERELHSRAMAGPDDRGSMQALLAIAKARAPEYREKSQLQLEVLHRAESAEATSFAYIEADVENNEARG